MHTGCPQHSKKFKFKQQKFKQQKIRLHLYVQYCD